MLSNLSVVGGTSRRDSMIWFLKLFKRLVYLQHYLRTLEDLTLL